LSATFASTPKPDWAKEAKADLETIRAVLREIMVNVGNTPDVRIKAAMLLHQLITG
jgi:hypothetical protein